MIKYKQAETAEEIEQILDLQKQNLAKSLTKKEKREHGFLTVEHSIDLLWKMNLDFPHNIGNFRRESRWLRTFHDSKIHTGY